VGAPEEALPAVGLTEHERAMLRLAHEEETLRRHPAAS
jgi:hypothetical protein